MVSGQFYCHSQAFAVNFLAAGAGCQGPAVAAPRRMSLQVPLREMNDGGGGRGDRGDRGDEPWERLRKVDEPWVPISENRGVNHQTW